MLTTGMFKIRVPTKIKINNKLSVLFRPVSLAKIEIIMT